MIQEITRLERSITRLLDFARPPQIERRVFDARSVVQEAVDLVAARARRQHVALGISLPDESAPLDADPEQIRQVVLNLLLNALDSTPEGGRVDIRLRSVEPSVTLVGDELRADAAVRRYEIEIADTGAGIGDEVLHRIFEPFVTSKDTGTGLGLSISRRIVQAHGGTVAGGNRSSGGAVFTVLLPERSTQAAESEMESTFNRSSIGVA